MKRGFAGHATMLAAAGVLASCSSTQSGSVSGSPSAVASGSASAQVVIIIPENSGTAPASNKIDLVHADGAQLTPLTMRKDVTVVAAAGSHVFVLVQQSGGQLQGVKADGTVETLGNIGTDNPNGFVPSPDGKRWLWGNSSFNGQSLSSAVDESGVGLSPMVLAQETTNNQQVMPYAWTKVAPMIMEGPNGIGGYIPFSPAYGPVRRLDPGAARLTPITTPSGCNFSDLSADGTVACFPNRSSGPTPEVEIVPPSGSSRIISLSLPRFRLLGDAYFSPDGKLLTVAGAEGLPMQPNGGSERYGLDLITVADGSIRRFGPDGLRPSEQLGAASWLPDGSLVLWRPAGAAGGDAGTYVVSPDGRATRISSYGPPIGLLTS